MCRSPSLASCARPTRCSDLHPLALVELSGLIHCNAIDVESGALPLPIAKTRFSSVAPLKVLSALPVRACGERLG
jgi:hypothetical protein